ncbi:hypothetical protein EJ110_NYTH44743 [Nymphaea thermarum]|nr:hypothetical protein EJ110_NYTH44743 [Nymphaea thermarum]
MQGPRASPWKPMKMEFPRFTGEDPVSWVFCSEQYFDCQAIVGDQRVNHAVMHFEGPAIRWYQWLVAQQGLVLVEAIATCFGPSSYLDYNVELSKIRQTSTLVDYQENSESLNNMVRGWPIELLVGAFVGGLRKFRIEVQALKPRSQAECFEISRTVEEKHSWLSFTKRGWSESHGVWKGITKAEASTPYKDERQVFRSRLHMYLVKEEADEEENCGMHFESGNDAQETREGRKTELRRYLYMHFQGMRRHN